MDLHIDDGRMTDGPGPEEYMAGAPPSSLSALANLALLICWRMKARTTTSSRRTDPRRRRSNHARPDRSDLIWSKHMHIYLTWLPDPLGAGGGGRKRIENLRSWCLYHGLPHRGQSGFYTKRFSISSTPDLAGVTSPVAGNGKAGDSNVSNPSTIDNKAAVAGKIADNEEPSSELDVITGDYASFKQMVTEGKTEIRKFFDISSLEESFEKDVRPLILKHLVFPRPLDRLAGLFHLRSSILLSHVPNYLSFLDVMIVKKVLHEHEFLLFLEHVNENCVFVARDWSKSYGSVEVLEHTKGPIDPTHTFKAEGDGSFDEVTKKARLGFVIFVRGKLGRVQVFFEVDCSSSIEAELLVNIALQDELSKLKLSRGTVWTDSLFCYNVMVGKQTIGINDPNRELLLLLRSMRLKFESLIPEWKPRQLLSLPDAVIRVCKSKDNLRRNDVMDTLETLSPFLSGSPRFRLKWSKDADTWRKDFEMHWSDQTHIPGRSSSIYWRKVDDEESKVSMIKECIKVFISDRLLLIIDHLEDKSEGFQREIGNFIKSHGIQKWKIGSYSGFICRPYEPNSVLVLRDRLVIGCDATIPLDFYRSCETASTVILLPEAHEVGKLEEAGLSEVNAEAYINFHNIKLPLEKAELCNEGEKGNATQSKKGKEGKQRKKWKKGKKGKKGKGRR